MIEPDAEYIESLIPELKLDAWQANMLRMAFGVSAPEPPMSEPLEQFAVVEIPGNGRAYRWAPNDSPTAWPWIWIRLDGHILGIDDWESLIAKSATNPRPVDEPALTLDAVLAVVRDCRYSNMESPDVRTWNHSNDAVAALLNAKFGGTR